MLSELDGLCSGGKEEPTEMTLLVILRLVEDVAVLQTLDQGQRRKEIYQALTSHMTEIFTFLLQILERHYKAYTDSHSQGSQRVCQAVLDTFSAFVEWVAMTHIMANDKYLLRVLCHLLNDPNLR